MIEFFTKRPVFASSIAVIMVLAGAISYFLLPVSQFPDITPPQVVVSAAYPGASAQVVADTVTTPLEQSDQRRAGHDLYVVVELERRLVEHHRDLRRRLSAQHRRRRRAKPGVTGVVVAAGDRQPGRRDDQKAEPEFRADRQSDLAGRFGRSGRAEQLRLSADRRSAQAPARRRRRADFRRAALFDAHLARSRQARQSRHHRRRRPARGHRSRTSRSRPARSASRRRRRARRSKCRSMPSAA